MSLREAITHTSKTDRVPSIFSLRATSSSEHQIIEIEKSLIRNDKSNDIDRSFQAYLNLRSCRHQLWVDLFSECVLQEGVKLNDVRVKDFVNLLRVSDSTIPEPPKSIENLSPDILYMKYPDNVIILGDISCSDSVFAANKRKYLKYQPVEEFLRNACNMRVLQMNLIIPNDLNGLEAILNKFVEKSIISVDRPRVVKARRFHELCCDLMNQIPRWCVQPVMLMNKITKADSLSSETPKLIIDVDGLDELEYIDPVRSEDNIIAEIKKIVDDKHGHFFDESFEDVKSAFRKLMNKSSKSNISNITTTEPKNTDVSNKSKEWNESTPAKIIKNDGDDKIEFCNPKATVKVCYNTSEIEDKSNHDLIDEYWFDVMPRNDEIQSYISNILPHPAYTQHMREYYKNKDYKCSEPNVYGPYQYKINYDLEIPMMAKLKEQLQYGKKIRNVKEKPKHLNSDNYNEYKCDMDTIIKYLGSTSEKSSFLDETWDASNNFEFDATTKEREIYDYVKSTNAAQLANSMSNLLQRINHLSLKQSKRDNIYIPPNGAFVCIIPKEHGLIDQSTCDIPFIFISRFRKSNYIEGSVEYEYKTESVEYVYLVSKLCRLNINIISNWDQAGYRFVNTCSYLLYSCPSLLPIKQEVAGVMCLLMLDVHQKTSMFLDLLKYISFMPFSDLSRLSKLIEDKFDLLIKTKLDVWILLKLYEFMCELSDKSKIEAMKPKIKMFNSQVLDSSLGMTLSLPSFINTNVRHTSIESFIEEISMIYIVRGKKLYGSQFMDDSFIKTAEWTNDYHNEVKEYGRWVIDGNGVGNYPFDSRYAFSSDAIIHALRYSEEYYNIPLYKVSNEVDKTCYNDYMHKNCSLRGCTKEKEDRSTINDIHSTSMDECLKHYKKVEFNEPKCTVMHIAQEMAKSDRVMQFSMSEKEQRGGGRPIATPTLSTKAALMCIDKPELALGKYMDNNIIVPGKNKLQEQTKAYKQCLSDGINSNFKEVYQLTEDQSKWSEQDNCRKFEIYINNNPWINKDIKRLQLTSLRKLNNREHITKKLPKAFKNDLNLASRLNDDGNGVTVNIGWPQGMLNFMSTSIHCIADVWITHAYNKAYPDNQVKTKGLVHSDDSWATVVCNSLDDFKRFTLFRIYAKRLFCLKVNEKKLWGSRYLGEMVSNFNINGNVHMSVAKTLANSMGNISYQNWVIDTHSQISSLQQCYRNGANIGTLIMLATILRQQLLSSYNVNDYQLKELYNLPVELGGYPNCSVFELGVTGVNCHYYKIYEDVRKNPNSVTSQLILKCLSLSMTYNAFQKYYNDPSNSEFAKITKIKDKDLPYLYVQSDNENFSDDFDNISLPNRGEVFSCISYKLPRSKKTASTIKTINSIDVDRGDLYMVVTRPKDLKTSLSNLKSQTSTMLYTLAAEHYTKSLRRLAVSQSMQASGNVVRIKGSIAMSFNGLYKYILQLDVNPASVTYLQAAFCDDDNVIPICSNIVNNSTKVVGNTRKGKQVNVMPNVEDKYKTIAKLRNVLLYIIDSKEGTNLLETYGDSVSETKILEMDSLNIKRRFNILFDYYNTRKACNIIMQQYYSRVKTRLWMQPYLSTNCLENFLEDLYGKTVNAEVNYIVSVQNYDVRYKSKASDIIDTIYTTLVMNEVYDKKFNITKYDGIQINTVIENLDYKDLSNESFLKLGIIKLVINNDQSMLKEYDKKRSYNEHYIKKQTLIGNRYVGELKVCITFGDLNMTIEGEPGNFTVIVNKLNTHDIVYCMWMFVKRNFPSLSYSNPNQWPHSGVWDNKFSMSSIYLKTYNHITYCSSTKSIGSFAITHNPNLRLQSEIIRSRDGDYTTDNFLRQVFKTSENHTYRIGVIKQSLSAPYIKNVLVNKDSLHGLDSQTLLSTKVIINLSKHQHQNITMDDVDECFSKSDIEMNGGILVGFFERLMKEVTSYDEDTEFGFFSEAEEMIIDEILTGGELKEMLGDISSKITPESLDHDEILAEYELESRQGSIYKCGNVLTKLCQIKATKVSEDKLRDLIIGILQTEQLSQLCVEQFYDTNIESMEIYIENLKYAPIDPDVYIFLVGNRFYEFSKDKRLKLDSLDYSKTLTDPYIIGMSDKIANILITKAFDRERVRSVTQFFKNALIAKQKASTSQE